MAAGYVKSGLDKIEKDPDRRIQEAIALVFRKFNELQTIRQVLVWLQQERIPFPALTSAKRPIGSFGERRYIQRSITS